jgi:hypothetical protein
MTTELRNQVNQWYAHLPLALRFPIDSTPLFDLRKAYLRAQYIALFVVIGWPSVLRILELGEQGADMQDNSPEVSVMMKQAKECLSSCALILAASEELLSRRNLGSHMMLWA